MFTSAQSIASRVTSEKTGCIRHLHKLTMRKSDPRIYCYYAEAANSLAFGDFMAGDRNSGAGLDHISAKLATIGEFFERYSCSFQKQNVVGRLAEIGGAIAPERFALFSQEQYQHPDFPFSKFDSSTHLSWTVAYSLLTSQSALIPSQFVYMPYMLVPDEAIIAPQISHGLACHQTMERALIGAILEVIERDAFTIFWLATLPAPRIILEYSKQSRDIERLKDIIGRHYFIPGIRYYLYDITNDIGLPSFFLLAESYGPAENIVTVGAATRTCAVDATRKAFLEAAQARPYIRYIRQSEPDWAVADDFRNITSFDEHARLYSYRPDLLNKISFLRTDSASEFQFEQFFKIQLSRTPACELSQLVQRLHQCGYEPFWIDLTTADAAEVGLSVVRVIVPGMHQLHGDHHIPFLGGERLARNLKRTAQKELSLESWKNLRFPHPFP